MNIASSNSSSGIMLIPIAEPTISYVTIRGRLYQVITWTRAQWEMIPRAERPKGAREHGDLMLDVQPA